MLDADSVVLLDRAYLARFTLSDATLEREVLDLFSQQAPEYLARIRNAGNKQDWREAAHTLKGSAAAIGAREIARLTELIERLDPPAPGAGRDALCRPIAAAIEATQVEIAAIAR